MSGNGTTANETETGADDNLFGFVVEGVLVPIL
jgi:hypothetical protein